MNCLSCLQAYVTLDIVAHPILVGINVFSRNQHILVESSRNQHVLIESSRNQHVLVESSRNQHVLVESSRNQHVLVESSRNQHVLIESSINQHFSRNQYAFVVVNMFKWNTISNN